MVDTHQMNEQWYLGTAMWNIGLRRLFSLEYTLKHILLLHLIKWKRSNMQALKHIQNIHTRYVSKMLSCSLTLQLITVGISAVTLNAAVAVAARPEQLQHDEYWTGNQPFSDNGRYTIASYHERYLQYIKRYLI